MSSSLISLSSSEPVEATPFDAIGSLACPIAVILGTASITVRECLKLERHTVLRLDQAAGEDLRVDVNGVTIASGEVAIIDTSTAIRLTDFTPSPRRRG